MRQVRSVLRRQRAIPAFGQATQETREWVGNPGFSRIRFGLWIPALRRRSAETGSITTAARDWKSGKNPAEGETHQMTIDIIRQLALTGATIMPGVRLRAWVLTPKNPALRPANYDPVRGCDQPRRVASVTWPDASMNSAKSRFVTA